VASDLSAISDCRRSAYGGKPANLLPAAKSFCDADQITRDGYVCVVATAAAEGEGGEKAAVVVVGTADLNTRTGVVNNVYVREEARKRGIARSMMVAVEDYYARWTGEGNDRGGKKKGRRKLSLTVMSKNLPAVGLYKGMGYAAPGVYGGLDALSSMSPLNFLIEMEKEISSPLYLGS
jgi:ribosomal protein S18 acetylase RimI-like enzyme